MLGAEQVVCIDNVPERLDMARAGGAITVDFNRESVLDRLQELTAGKGPDKCIDAVGMESHSLRSIDAMIDSVKQSVMIESDRPHVLREMIYVCRPAGTLSVAGVYGGMADKIPVGALMNKGADGEDRPDPRQPLDRRAAAAHRRRPDRPLVRHHPQRRPRRRAQHVPDLSRQGGRLRQGRHEAMSLDTACKPNTADRNAKEVQ